MTTELTGGMPLDILTDAHPVLKQRAAPIGTPTDEIRGLARDMLATMYAAKGVGLAAPQVGRSVRLLVMDGGGPEAPNPIVMIDPVVTWRSSRTERAREGCLSLPDRLVGVERATNVKVAWTTLDGTRVERGMRDWEARIVQHEIDHLDGVLITDRAA